MFTDAKDAGRKCIVDVTVDDLLFVTNVPQYRDDLLAASTARIGPLTVNIVSVVHTEIEMTRLANGGILLTQDKAIARAASAVGVSHSPPIDVPTDSTFFLPEYVGDEAVPVPSDEYSSVTGRLVQFLKTHPDCLLFVSYLCGFRRALHVLRYLASTAGVGPIFKSASVEIVVYSDAAYAVFRDGYSSSGYMFSVGVSNAPFYAVAKAQTEVATCPMTAEYYAACAACKKLAYLRQVAFFLGWEAWSPDLFDLDCKTAIKLIQATQVSVKCRNIEQTRHYIRKEHLLGNITVMHVPAAEMRADILTKHLPRAQYLRPRAGLLNSRCYVSSASSSVWAAIRMPKC